MMTLGGFPSGSVITSLPANAGDIGDTGSVPGWEEMATRSSILAWRIPWTEEPGGLRSTGLQRAGHDLLTKQQYFLQLTLYLA